MRPEHFPIVSRSTPAPRRVLTLPLSLTLAAAALSFVATSGVAAQQEAIRNSYQFTESRIDNSQETRLFPAKVPVPGVLWGTNPGYTAGMVMLKISCGVDDRRVVTNAAGDEEEIYAALFRVEMFRYDADEDEWTYVDWYSLPGTPPVASCESLQAAAALVHAQRPLTVSLRIRASGTLHRNLVEGWKF
jgi:hypothetical protein